MEFKMQKNPKKEKQSSFWNNVFNNDEKTINHGIGEQNLPSLSDIRVEDIESFDFRRVEKGNACREKKEKLHHQ